MTIRIFDRYIWKQVFSATLTGVMVLSGVMVLGNVYKKLDQLLGDTHLPMTLVLEFIGLVIPFSLIFTIPWAFLTGILLVFGRMSADNEMVSMRMTGTPMWRICLPVFVLAALLCSLCFYVNINLAPWAKNQMKRLFYDVVTEDPISLFQADRVIDKFPGYRIYTGKKRDDGTLEDLQILKLNGNRGELFIRARTAELVVTPGQLDFVLKLKDANFEKVDTDLAGGVDKVDTPAIGETAITFPLSDLKDKTERVNASMKSTTALWGEVWTGNDSITGLPLDKKNLSVTKTEVSKRYSFSLACITFALIGIPLAITAQRRETTIGFVLSLVTAVVYITLIMVADSLNEKRSLYPHLLMWLPNVLFLSIGGTLFYKLSKK